MENYIDTTFRTSYHTNTVSNLHPTPTPVSGLDSRLVPNTAAQPRSPPRRRSTRRTLPTSSREVAAGLQESSGVPCTRSPTYARQFPVGLRWSPRSGNPLQAPYQEPPRATAARVPSVRQLSAHRTSPPLPTVALAPATYTRTWVRKSPLQAHLAWSYLPSLYACCSGGIVFDRSHRHLLLSQLFFWSYFHSISRRPIPKYIGMSI